MTYDEAISFWYGRINYEVRSAGPLDLKLERMHALLRRLGDPQDRLRLVHVTGTKGKGSTCAMLASVLRAAGYRVGLFTSPHLEHVEERMQVDGVPISHAELAARMEEVAPAVRAMEEETTLPSPTFFEIGTALGFLHFVRRRVDIAILEVGLGGRFDSTNVCQPLVSVVTNIGFDHTAQLGNTLEAIAYQKAGIIKRRVPVVSGVTQPGPRAVIRKVAAEMDTPLWEVGSQPTPPAPLPKGKGELTQGVPEVGATAPVDASSVSPFPLGRGAGGVGSDSNPSPTPPASLPGPVSRASHGPGEGKGELARETAAFEATSPSRAGSVSPFPLGRGAGGVGSSLGLLGAHQVQNATIAVAVIDRLREAGMHISEVAIARGLADVKWPARIEVIRARPIVVLDTAHNVPSAEALVSTLRAAFPQSGTKRVVFAVSSDKQFADILRVLADYFDHFHLTKYGNNPRGVSPEKLAATLATVAPGKPFSAHATASDAWNAARSATTESDLVCITGSVFLAGELRPVLTDI